MNKIAETILSNLQLKAGDLNEDGKFLKVVEAYEGILDKLVVYADTLSKNHRCGGCGKHKTAISHEEVYASDRASYASEIPEPEARPYAQPEHKEFIGPIDDPEPGFVRVSTEVSSPTLSTPDGLPQPKAYPRGEK